MIPTGAQWICAGFLILLAVHSEAATDPYIVCYYTNWSVYRIGMGMFPTQNIDPHICTHLIYAFGSFSKDATLNPSDAFQDINMDGYALFTDLKVANPKLKTMLSIGGTAEGSQSFSIISSDDSRRKLFTRNVVKFLRNYRFDGLDLDWNRPGFGRGGKPEDKANYAKLLQELREEFDAEADEGNRMLLSISVPKEKEYIDKGYDIAVLNKYLDWMSIRAYDYHMVLEPVVNHHSPLFPLSSQPDDDLNVNSTVQHYLNAGVDRSKLVLGIPTFGRSFTLSDTGATSIGSAASGPGDKAPFTGEYGYMAYYEICSNVLQNNDSDARWTVVQPDPKAVGPYAYKGDQWVGYDDIGSVQRKAKYANQHGLRGLMFWTLDIDDFHGNCHGRPYPLINAAKEAFNESSIPSLPDGITPKTPETPMEVEKQTERKLKGTATAQRRIVCYYTNWSVYRSGMGQFPTSVIDPNLCTHLIYAFGGFTKDGKVVPSDPFQDISMDGYVLFTNLKISNPNLKTMLAIGGTNEGSSTFSSIAADETKRREFISNTVKFLSSHRFDGLDLDWNRPGFGRGARSNDKANFVKLVKEMREEFDAEQDGDQRLLLSIAVPKEMEFIDKGYDITKLNKYVDWMNIRTYDYYSAFASQVNHHSPLYPINSTDQLNINSTVKYYLDAGVNSNKLVLGIPTFGRSFTLQDPTATMLGSPAAGPGDKGIATGENGYLSFYEICSLAGIVGDEWTEVHPDGDAIGPYGFFGDQWVGYDDVKSVQKKTEFVIQNNFGGVMFWSIDNDDFGGYCKGIKFPLINAAKDALQKETITTPVKVGNNDKNNNILENKNDPVPKFRTRMGSDSEPRIVCYYTNWSVYRPGVGKFPTSAIDPYLCTHVLYAYGGITKQGTLTPSDSYQDIDMDGYITFVGLKKENPKLKTMLSIGGTTEGSSTFSLITASDNLRKELIKNTIKFLRDNKFDGIDLNWNSPTTGKGGKPEDKDNYVKLVREFREEIEAEADDLPKLVLSLTVPKGKEIIDSGYDIREHNKYVDWMAIRSYDYYSQLGPAVNNPAPLLSLNTTSEDNLNANSTVQYYIKSGADRDKLLLSMPTFGRTFTLEDPNLTAIGSPATGPGEKGVATGTAGFLAYYEICQNLRTNGWTSLYDNPLAVGPIAFKGNQWVGYDDVRSVQRKAEYTAQEGLGGLMFWTIDMDDFQGLCHGRTYPLINSAKEALYSSRGIAIPARAKIPTRTTVTTIASTTNIASTSPMTTESAVTDIAITRKVTEPRVVCYYTNWSVYRPGVGKFPTSAIDPYLCTHVLYAYGGITKEGGLSPSDSYQDIDMDGYITFVGLKKANPKLKTMLSIGGTTEGSLTFSLITASDNLRKELIKNTIKFLRDNKFDGIDLNWNSPTTGKGGKPEDKDNYVKLVREFREEIEAEADDFPKLVLSLTVPKGKEIIDGGYDIREHNKYVDWMAIRSYDYYSQLGSVVNNPAPLLSLNITSEDDLNANSTVQYYIKLGADRDKLLLSLPTFGRTFTLEDPNLTTIGSPAIGPGEKGVATGTAGFLAYYEICQNLLTNGWTSSYKDSRAVGPIAFKGNQWVGYEDVRSAQKKAEYAAEEGLGGLMFWTIDMDDFQGLCHGRTYPLINSAKETLFRSYGIEIPTTTMKSDMTSSLTTAVASSSTVTPATMKATESSPVEVSSVAPRKVVTEPRVVCYYTNWSVYRSGIGKFQTSAIDPHLCTHVLYAYGGISKEGMLSPSDSYQDINMDGYIKFTGLKMVNPKLKTILSIGGTNEGSRTFSFITTESRRRENFIKNIIKFVRENKFDGIDLNWNSPAFGKGGKAEDKDNYGKLVRELREEISSEAEPDSQLLLTITVPRGKDLIDNGYNIPELNKYVDWIAIRSYDYYSAIDAVVNHPSPLFAYNASYPGDLNTNYTVQYFINAGAERDKLLLGIPTFGLTYTLADSNTTGIGSPATGPGEKGAVTGTNGFLAYYEICTNNLASNNNSWSVVQSNPAANGPYAYKGDQWVAYEDIGSIQRKAEYAAQEGLGGLMFWTVDMDDFQGLCHGRTFPLINSGKETLYRSLGLEVPLTTSTTTIASTVSFASSTKASTTVTTPVTSPTSPTSAPTVQTTSATPSIRRVTTEESVKSSVTPANIDTVSKTTTSVIVSTSTGKPTELPAMDNRDLVTPSSASSIQDSSNNVDNEPLIVCYYTNWSVYRPGVGKYPTSSIDPHLCTHVVYAFGGISMEGMLRPADPYQDIDMDGYVIFNRLKTFNPKLKTMLAIGGASEGSTTLSHLLADDDRRATFIQNIIKFLRMNKFDGIDIDWDFPVVGRGGKPEDKENYVKFLRELRGEIEMEAEGRPKLLLTVALPGYMDFIKMGYDIPQLNRYVDWMNVRVYDYYSPSDDLVNHHAPLFALETNPSNKLNADSSIQFIIDSGAAREKLVLGIPTYGRTFTLDNVNLTDIGSDSSAPGEKGPITGERGFLAYFEICSSLLSTNDSNGEMWTVKRPDSRAIGPYAYRGDQWVGYEDVSSVQRKAEYAAQQGLRGLMFWTMEMDDFRGICHGKPYPLINGAKSAIRASLGLPTTTVPTTTEAKTTSAIPVISTATSTSTETPKTPISTSVPTTTTSDTVPPTFARGVSTPSTLEDSNLVVTVPTQSTSTQSSEIQNLLNLIKEFGGVEQLKKVLSAGVTRDASQSTTTPRSTSPPLVINRPEESDVRRKPPSSSQNMRSPVITLSEGGSNLSVPNQYTPPAGTPVGQDNNYSISYPTSDFYGSNEGGNNSSGIQPIAISSKVSVHYSEDPYPSPVSYVSNVAVALPEDPLWIPVSFASDVKFVYSDVTPSQSVDGGRREIAQSNLSTNNRVTVNRKHISGKRSHLVLVSNTSAPLIKRYFNNSQSDSNYSNSFVSRDNIRADIDDSHNQQTRQTTTLDSSSYDKTKLNEDIESVFGKQNTYPPLRFGASQPLLNSKSENLKLAQKRSDYLKTDKPKRPRTSRSFRVNNRKLSSNPIRTTSFNLEAQESGLVVEPNTWKQAINFPVKLDLLDDKVESNSKSQNIQRSPRRRPSSPSLTERQTDIRNGESSIINPEIISSKDVENQKKTNRGHVRYITNGY